MGQMYKLLISAAALAAVAVAPAGAQSNPSLSGNLQSVSISEASALLGELGVQSQAQSTGAGQTPMLLAQTEGGAKFLLGFFDCADAANAKGCKQVMVSTAQSSSGVEFDDMNAFNGSSSVTTVVYESSNQILIFGRNIFMPGGIGRDNFKLQVALFLQDMQQFVSNRSVGAKSVAFGVQPAPKGKISSIVPDASLPVFKHMRVSADGSAEVAMAIANTNDVDFSVDFTPAK
jgi:hypothetical protein